MLSLVPAFQSNTEKAERGWSIATGSLLGVASLCSLLLSDSVSLYAADLNSLGFELVASPTNLGFRYRF